MGKAKLTDEQKAEAYRLYTEQGRTYKQIAQQFDVSIPTAACAVSEHEKKHRWDDPAQAPLACDQTGDDQSGKPATPQSVVDAISDTIAMLALEIEKREQSIKDQQREVDAMHKRLSEMRKWKEGQAC